MSLRALLTRRRHGSREGPGHPTTPFTLHLRYGPYLLDFPGLNRCSLTAREAGQGWRAASGDPYLLRVAGAPSRCLVARQSGRAECDSAWSPEAAPRPWPAVTTSNLGGKLALCLAPLRASGRQRRRRSLRGRATP